MTARLRPESLQTVASCLNNVLESPHRARIRPEGVTQREQKQCFVGKGGREDHLPSIVQGIASVLGIQTRSLHVGL